MFNQTTITQVGICKGKLEHNNKQKMYNFSVVPGNWQVLLGMPDIEILSILTINCNTLGTKETDRAANCSTNTAITQGAGCDQNYTNTKQDAGRSGRYYTNTSINSNLNSNSADKPTINSYEIEYVLPGPNQGNEKKVSVKITKQLQRDFEDF